MKKILSFFLVMSLAALSGKIFIFAKIIRFVYEKTIQGIFCNGVFWSCVMCSKGGFFGEYAASDGLLADFCGCGAYR
jgi:hypothetical protein